MSGWRIVQMCLLVLNIALIGLWMSNGFQVFTKDKTEIVILQKDDIFGTTVENREWVDNFQFGLLPDDPIQPFRSLSFFLIVSGVGIMIAQKKISKSTKTSS